jgi:hypothetical protein
MLLSYMHSNIAQIGRTWVAASLIQSHITTEPIQELLSTPYTSYTGPTAPSNPYSLIGWETQP